MAKQNNNNKTIMIIIAIIAVFVIMNNKGFMGAAGDLPATADPLTIDWRDPLSWTGRLNAVWNTTENALQFTGSQNVYLTTKIPIDTSKRYYIEYDIMIATNGSFKTFSGTKSFATIDGEMLPGHPGSFDYFGDVGQFFTVGQWYHRKNTAIEGMARTGESSNVSEYNKWHTGTHYANLLFVLNYGDSYWKQTTLIKNLKFYEEGCSKTCAYLVCECKPTCAYVIDSYNVFKDCVVSGETKSVCNAIGHYATDGNCEIPATSPMCGINTNTSFTTMELCNKSLEPKDYTMWYIIGGVALLLIIILLKGGN